MEIKDSRTASSDMYGMDLI
jgi:hypothetical protein